MESESAVITSSTLALSAEAGSEELVVVGEDGRWRWYTEDGKRAGCNPQGWTAAGIIALASIEHQRQERANLASTAA